jgi:hypothetical protein
LFATAGGIAPTPVPEEVSDYLRVKKKYNVIKMKMPTLPRRAPHLAGTTPVSRPVPPLGKEFGNHGLDLTGSGPGEQSQDLLMFSI